MSKVRLHWCCGAPVGEPHLSSCSVGELEGLRRERDLAEAALTRVSTELIEAQEAALNYWEAWKDAAVYWKEELNETRGLAGECFDFLVDMGAYGDWKRLPSRIQDRRFVLCERLAEQSWIVEAEVPIRWASASPLEEVTADEKTPGPD